MALFVASFFALSWQCALPLIAALALQLSFPLGVAERGAWQPATPPDLSAYDRIQLDFETDGLEWWKGARPVGVAVGYGGQQCYLPFAHRGGGNLDENQVKEWARRELRGKRIENLKTSFDMHMSRAWGVDLAEQHNTFHDVSHSAALLNDYRREFSLAALSRDFLPEGRRKHAYPIDPAQIHLLPGWAVEPYACGDVAPVADLADIFRPQLAAEGLERVQALEDALLPATVEMEHNGCLLDEELLHQWLGQTEHELEETLWTLSRQAGFQVNPDSADHLTRIFKQLGLPVTQFTATGAPSFTAEVLDPIEHPTIKQIVYAGKLADLRNKFLKPYAGLVHDGHLYPTFHQLMCDDGGTVSGRFSCARPNVQQVIGKDKLKRAYAGLGQYQIRRLFISRSGVWYCADQAQVEYRLAVHFAYATHLAGISGLAGAEAMVQRYRDDPTTDFHDLVGELLKRYRPGMTRTELKTSNFMKLFGGQGRSLAKKLKIPEAEGYELFDQYDRAFPAMGRLLKVCEATAESRGYVKSIFGRRCRFPRINGQRQRTYAALNKIIQPSAADLFKQAVVDVYEARKELGFTLRVVVHDEIGGDLADESQREGFTQFLNQQRAPLHVPILWEGATGANWHAAKDAA